MSNQTQQPPLRPGDLVRFIPDRDHVEAVVSVQWVTEAARLHWQVITRWDGNCRIADAAEFIIEGSGAMTRHLSEAEARFLSTRDEILARRNPELLERENAEFEGMTDEELRAIAGRSFGADDLNEPPSDENPVELWAKYQQAFTLFDALADPSEEDEATFCAVVGEIERIATDQAPMALEGVLLRLQLIQHHQETIMWGEFEDKLIAHAIRALEAMAAGGEPSADG